MSVDVRPEYLDTDNTAWFFESGSVPTFNCTTGTLGDLLGLVGFIAEDVDSAGYLPAGEVLRGADDALKTKQLDSRTVVLLRHLRDVAIWAVDHNRRVEWC